MKINTLVVKIKQLFKDQAILFTSIERFLAIKGGKVHAPLDMYAA